jgi:hypothetical protein
MLTLPTLGVRRSITVHNIDLIKFCDWIEANILFVEDELSSTDIIDNLIEENIYEDQDFAHEFVSDAYAELERRLKCIGGTLPYDINQRMLTRRNTWQDYPAYSFCILVTLSKCYEEWTNRFGEDYNLQGEIFEHITKESVQIQFSEWKTYLTGWSRTNTTRLTDIVKNIAEKLGENVGDLELWNEPHAKENGLDLLIYRPFNDNRIGIPVYLIQCASGELTRGKMKEPDLAIWNDCISFKIKPNKALSTPFTFCDRDFQKNCTIIEGMLLDRCRLLSAGKYDESWLSQDISLKIIKWAIPRIEYLQTIAN